MANEAEYRHELHQQLVSQGAVRYLQTAPIACGGVTRLVALNSLLESDISAQIRLSLEVSSTAVALITACHYAAATSTVAHTEYHFLHQVFFELLEFSLVSERPGWFQLSAKPGLGISLPLSECKVEFDICV